MPKRLSNGFDSPTRNKVSTGFPTSLIPKSESKVKLISTFKAMLTTAGKSDVNLGRSVFAKTCQNCHLLYGVGNKIGPDRMGSNRSNLDYLLYNFVDPSAVMDKEYRSTIILTSDGRVVTRLVLE
jgi:hypothetical protein